MEMISAQKARKISGKTAKEEVHEIMGKIQKAAKNQDRHVNLHGKFWAREAYDNTPRYKKACNILISLGYEVRFFYRDAQFADFYTIVEW